MTSDVSISGISTYLQLQYRIPGIHICCRWQTVYVQLDEDISARLAKASHAFDRLPTRLWDDHEIRLGTKISVYVATCCHPVHPSLRLRIMEPLPSPHKEIRPVSHALFMSNCVELSNRKGATELISWAFQTGKRFFGIPWNDFFHRSENTATRVHSGKLLKSHLSLCVIVNCLQFFSQRVINRWNV